MTASPASRRVSPGEIADLVARGRRLTETPAANDPGERAAYLAAKADVLARIAQTHAHKNPCHTDDARTVAEHPAALQRTGTTDLGDSQ